MSFERLMPILKYDAQFAVWPVDGKLAYGRKQSDAAALILHELYKAVRKNPPKDILETLLLIAILLNGNGKYNMSLLSNGLAGWSVGGKKDVAHFINSIFIVCFMKHFVITITNRREKCFYFYTQTMDNMDNANKKESLVSTMTSFVRNIFSRSKATSRADDRIDECMLIDSFGMPDPIGIPQILLKILPSIAQKLESEKWLEIISSAFDDGILYPADIRYMMTKDVEKLSLQWQLLIVFWFFRGVGHCNKEESFIKQVIEGSEGNVMTNTLWDSVFSSQN